MMQQNLVDMLSMSARNIQYNQQNLMQQMMVLNQIQATAYA
jgi:hypothetical protein